MEKFLDSEYFVRQKEVEEEVLEPLKPDSPTQETVKTEVRQPGAELAVRRLLAEHHINLNKLRRRWRVVSWTVGAILGPVVVLIIVLTAAFLVNPSSTAKKFNLLAWLR